MSDQKKKQKPEIIQPDPDIILPAGENSSDEQSLIIPPSPAEQERRQPEVM